MKLANFKSKSKSYIFSIIAVFVIIILSSALYSNTDDKQKLSAENEQYISEINALNNSISEKDKIIEDNEASIQSLKDSKKKLKQKVSRYKDQQEQIDELNSKYNELLENYNNLLSEYEKAQNEIESLNSQISSLKTESASVAAASSQQATESSPSGGTVYWVSGGSVYHSTPNCPTLSRSGNIQSGSVASSGKSRGCKVCN